MQTWIYKVVWGTNLIQASTWFSKKNINPKFCNLPKVFYKELYDVNVGFAMKNYKVIQRNPLAVKKFNFKWKGMNEAYFLLKLWACMEFRIPSVSVVKIEVLCMQF